MARIDYLPSDSIENAVESAIAYCKQQSENKSKAQAENKSSKFTEADRVWFKADNNTIWVITLDKKVKYAMPEHIATLDLATQGKSLYDGLTEEAKQMLSNTTAINQFEVSREVLNDVFTTSRKKIISSLEKVYQVIV